MAAASVEAADAAWPVDEAKDDYLAPGGGEREGEGEAPEAPELAPAADFGNSSITDADFESLRMQLAEVSDALARKATSETRVIKQLRGALQSARDQLGALVSQASSGASTEPSPTLAPNLEELVSIARQAADNPRHLDYLTALAEHAAEIADALEGSSSGASPAGGGIKTPELEALRARLDEALG
jgi:hypothetical protein